MHAFVPQSFLWGFCMCEDCLKSVSWYETHIEFHDAAMYFELLGLSSYIVNFNKNGCWTLLISRNVWLQEICKYFPISPFQTKNHQKAQPPLPLPPTQHHCQTLHPAQGTASPTFDIAGPAQTGRFLASMSRIPPKPDILGAGWCRLFLVKPRVLTIPVRPLL